MTAQYVIRSTDGRFVTHTNDLRYAFDFARHWTEYMQQPCKVTNTQNAHTVMFNRFGTVQVQQHTHRDLYAGLQPCTYAYCTEE